MNQLLTPQNIFDLFVALGGIAFICAQVLQGRSAKKSSDEQDALTTIKLKDAAISELRAETIRMNSVIIQDGKDIAVLKAENKRLTDLVLNRNPELETFMKDTRASILVIENSINKLLTLHLRPSPVPTDHEKSE